MNVPPMNVPTPTRAPAPLSRWSLVTALACSACGAQGSDDADDGGGGKADDIDPADFACKSVDGITLEALVEIDDPIAAFLIKRGEGCPANYREMVEKLNSVDPEGCVAGGELTTRIVSDDARIDPTPDNYRTVTTRACGSRPAHSIFWTLLTVRTGEDIGLRTFVEMQALDRTSGLYNYWVFGGGRFSFNGDSLQAAAGTTACGGCHRDGGVLMKELDEPWIHWESEGKPLPGVDALFTAHGAMFGQRGDGRELEKLVRTGNDAIVTARIDVQSKPEIGTVAKLLRPLFCNEQLNLDTAGNEVDAPLTSIPADVLFDPRWGIARGVAIDPVVYDAAIVDAGQTVPGVAGRTDTEFKLVFPERSGFDDAYVQALVAQGVIDEDFLLDVLAVDFTRPLFSDARCGLLAFAPAYGDPAPSATTTGDDGMSEGTSTDDGMSTDDGGSSDDGTTGGDGVDVGTCCAAGTGKGCSNATIQACVCAKDAFCCDNTWDSACVSNVVGFMCGMCPSAPPPPPPPSGTGIVIPKAEPAAIREAFIAALQKAAPPAGTPAAELLASLSDTSDAASHRERVDAFLAACEARDERPFVDDVLRFTQLTKGLMRTTTSLIEHSEQLSQTMLPVAASAHLDPATCTLVE